MICFAPPRCSLRTLATASGSPKPRGLFLVFVLETLYHTLLGGARQEGEK
jgi:hypothetical protein